MNLSSYNVGENHSHDLGTDVVPAWKQELNERLAATRLRRLRVAGEQVPLPGMEPVEGGLPPSRASRLAAKVAQRYANAPSYSDVLTGQVRSDARSEMEAAPAAALPQPLAEAEAEAEWISGKVELHAAVAPVNAQPLVEESQKEPVVEPLAVNLVEFPRELVATHKARPRLVEGPLRESSQTAEPELPLKIGTVSADWSPIRLEAEPIPEEEPKGEGTPLKAATLEDRMMAGIFDLALVFAAFALFVLVFFACTTHPPTGRPALIGAGFALGSFFLLYQYLFFKFAEGTPGMRYAKIALCTFEDGNPTRRAMCRRVFFLLLSAAPLGLGFLWACFDPDRLGWHDRMSRIYQRSYSA